MIDHIRSPENISPGEGWYFVGELITLESPLCDVRDPGLRFANIQDIGWCRALAFNAFSHDRMHADPNVDKRSASLQKAYEIEQCIRLGVPVFVSGFVGFVTCQAGRIGLIAVDPNCRNQGIGSRLIEAVNAYYGGGVRVGTQATNLPALALYKGLGFVEVKREYDFHRCSASASSPS